MDNGSVVAFNAGITTRNVGDQHGDRRLRGECGTGPGACGQQHGALVDADCAEPGADISAVRHDAWRPAVLSEPPPCSAHRQPAPTTLTPIPPPSPARRPHFCPPAPTPVLPPL